MKDQIKSYLQRLNHGEPLENVQADFVRECKDVDPSAIMQAEQELLREGTSIEELQRLCDVHSALFHGSATDAQKLHAKCSCAKFLSQLLIIFDTNFRKIFSEFNTRNGGIFALRFFDI